MTRIYLCDIFISGCKIEKKIIIQKLHCHGFSDVFTTVSLPLTMRSSQGCQKALVSSALTSAWKPNVLFRNSTLQYRKDQRSPSPLSSLTIPATTIKRFHHSQPIWRHKRHGGSRDLFTIQQEDLGIFRLALFVVLFFISNINYSLCYTRHLVIKLIYL